MSGMINLHLWDLVNMAIELRLLLKMGNSLTTGTAVDVEEQFCCTDIREYAIVQHPHMPIKL